MKLKLKVLPLVLHDYFHEVKNTKRYFYNSIFDTVSPIGTCILSLHAVFFGSHFRDRAIIKSFFYNFT